MYKSQTQPPQVTDKQAPPAALHTPRSQFPAVNNRHLLTTSASLRAHILHLPHHVHALNHLTEHHMRPIQPISLLRAQKELTPVRVRPRVRHRNSARACMLQHKVFISKLLSVDALAAGAIAPREIATLAHELRYDTMKRAAFEAEAFLLCTKGAEVLRSHWYNVGSQFNDNTARVSSAYSDHHENSRVGLEFLSWQGLVACVRRLGWLAVL